MTVVDTVELEPAHAEIVRATLPLIGAHIDEITTAFYRRMFGNHPELLRNLFNRGNQAQGAQQRALAASIATFATHLVAGGTELVLACDLVVASKTAVFGIPEVKRNLVAGAGGLFRLPRKIPRNIAMELALTGRLDFPAERAHHFGLVNRLCPEGQALDTALALAAEVTTAAPLAVRESRSIILQATDQPDEVGWKLSGEGIIKMFGTEDFSEGLTAFAEKRKPNWKGR